MRSGPRWTALLREARDACVIVVGSRGQGPLTSMMLGSVSLGVAGRPPARLS
jgi:nucleotide-binding universal stress UspA family protein